MCGEGKKKLSERKKIQDGGIHKSKQVNKKRKKWRRISSIKFTTNLQFTKQIRVTAPFRNSQPE